MAATLHSRLLLDARVDYINREIGTPDTQLREEYPSVQVAMHYSYSASPDAGPLDVDIGSTFRKGLRSEVAPTGAALDYFLWRPTVSVNQIGRASCRDRVCQYVYISVVAVYFTKQ